ncbi:MAG: transporter substrate-binding domain-containing protein [Candidatus Cloacimonadales bacterium]|jgi:CheY-like chemotaxis protein/nitrogen-specific signal transduction histidine kinase|nr:transporter substrate-binding domain-containing protein [Candidatus Cloacimonadales bacterium]
MKRVLIIFILVLMLSSLNARTIKVGIYENKPLVYIDSKKQPVGLFIDVLEYVAKEEDWTIDYVYSSWYDSLDLLEKGLIDLLVDIAYTPSRAKLYEFNDENVFLNWGVVYVNNHDIKSILDLNRMNIAGVKGDLYYEEFVKLLTMFDINCNFIPVSEYSESLKLVDENLADAGIVNRLFGSQNQKYYNIIKSDIIFESSELRYAAPKNKNKDILHIIDSYLIKMKNDSNSLYYKSLENHISGTKQANSFSNHSLELDISFLIILTISLCAIIILLILLYRSKKLHKLFQTLPLALKKQYPYTYIQYDKNFKIIKSNSTTELNSFTTSNKEPQNIKDFLETDNSLINFDHVIYKNIKFKNKSLIDNHFAIIFRDMKNKAYYDMFILENLSSAKLLKTYQQENQYLVDILQNLPNPYLIYNEKGEIVKANKALLDFNKIYENHSTLKNLYELFNHDIIKEINEHFTMTNNRFTKQTELNLTNTQNALVNIEVIKLEHTNNAFFIMSISKEIQAEYEVTKIISIIDKLPYPAFITDDMNMVIAINTALCHTFKIQSTEVLKKDTKSFFDKSFSGAFQYEDFLWANTNVSFSDNMPQQVNIMKINITIQQQKSVNLFFLNKTDQICNDVSDGNLYSNKQNLEFILNHIEDMIVYVNQYGEIKYYNNSFYEKSMSKEKSLTGLKIFDILYIRKKNEELKNLMTDNSFDKTVAIHDCGIEFLIGDEIKLEHMSVYFNKYIDESNKTIVIIVIKDHSKIIKMHKELLKLKNLDVLQKSSLKIANDFNNILTAIMGHISLLKLSHGVPQYMLDRINKAEEASVKAKELAYKLFPLDLQMNEQAQYYKVEELLETISIEGSNNISLNIHIAKDMPKVYICKNNTISAIGKIIQNSIDSMPDGGEINITAYKTKIEKDNFYNLAVGDYIVIKICDTGKGIEKEYLEIVFEPYFSLNNKNGLGLTQAFHKLVRQNAYLSLNSELKKGTCAEIILPCSTSKSKATDYELELNKDIKVLIMDDEQLVLDVAKEYLNRLGFQTTTTENGEGVMQILKEDSSFDVVILDLVVSNGMGAKETIKLLRKQYPDLVVFLSTGLKTELTLLNFKKHGYNDVIEKPIDFNILKEKIYRSLRK